MPTQPHPPSHPPHRALRMARCSLAAWALCASLSPAGAQKPDAGAAASATPADPQAACQAYQAEQDRQYALVADPRGDRRTSIDRQKLAELRRQCQGTEDAADTTAAALTTPATPAP